MCTNEIEDTFDADIDISDDSEEGYEQFVPQKQMDL